MLARNAANISKEASIRVHKAHYLSFPYVIMVTLDDSMFIYPNLDPNSSPAVPPGGSAE